MIESVVEVRGLRLCLCAWGPADGPIVLCLHGFLDQGASWSAVAEHLAGQGYRVVAPDARGHGRSEHVGAGGYYHFADYLVDVEGIVRHLTSAPLVLVGHSMGGTVATIYAGLRPDAVATLVNIEGLGPPRVSDDDAVQRMVSHLDQMAEPPRHRTMADVEEAAGRMRRYTPELSQQLARRLATRVTVPVDGGVTWSWDPLHRTYGPYAFDEDRFCRVLARITAPVTLIVGDRSPPWFEAVAGRQAHIAGCRQVSLSTGHHPHLELPERLADEIDAAIRLTPTRPQEETR